MGLVDPEPKEIRIIHKGDSVHSINRTMELTESQKTALRWIDIYHLSNITENPRPDAIRDLEGMMKDLADDNESPVEAIRNIRENLY